MDAWMACRNALVSHALSWSGALIWDENPDARFKPFIVPISCQGRMKGFGRPPPAPASDRPTLWELAFNVNPETSPLEKAFNPALRAPTSHQILSLVTTPELRSWPTTLPLEPHRFCLRSSAAHLIPFTACEGIGVASNGSPHFLFSHLKFLPPAAEFGNLNGSDPCKRDLAQMP